jgi:hypothetical protein
VLVRCTVIEGDPSTLDQGIAFVRQRVLPAVDRLEGSLGLTMVANRSTGHTVTSTLWGTRVQMAASGAVLTPLRHEAGSVLGGIPLAEEWEVADLYRARRDQPGFGVRSTRLEFDPADAEHLVDTVRTTTVPALALLDGFASATLLIDLDGGVGVALASFADRRAMEDSRRAAAEIRRTTVEKAHAHVTEITEGDLVIAATHLLDQA